MTNSFTSILSTFVVLIFLFCSAHAQNIKRPKFSVGLDLSPEAASERWQEFSKSKLGGDYCMMFEIKHRPRKSEEIKYVGYMLGSEKNGIVYTRIRVAPASTPTKIEEYIFKNAPSKSEVWKLKNDKFELLPHKDWTSPICAGLLYSPFDLLMPYKHWIPTYVGADKIGQAVHLYDLTSSEFPSKTVRVALTRDFNAPAQIVIFGKDEYKTANLGSVKKVDGLWIMREASVKDERTKDKDILRFTAAKFKLNLPISIFLPDAPKNINLPVMKRL